MRKLRWVIDQLPGVRPRLASVGIKNGLVPGVMDDIHFMHGDFGPSFLVGPTAARLILDAYLQGLLPMEPGTAPAATSAMTEYLDKADALAAEADAHRRTRHGADPFEDWRAMEEAFRRRGHPVPDRLEIGRVMVERRGNGGRDPKPDEIRFHWTERHGEAWVLHRRHGRWRDD